MTTEKMVMDWFNEYEEKKKQLSASYDFGFERLPVNEAGETSAEALLDLNRWYEDQENKIRTEMMLKAKAMFGKED
jgi:hypothetical protein